MEPNMRTFEDFCQQVKDSCEKHASRKGYSDGGVDGENPLAEFMNKIGADPGHSVGEIIFKCVEYLKSPREVSLIKIAAWAYLVWKYCDHEAHGDADKQRQPPSVSNRHRNTRVRDYSVGK